jgi:lipoprotein-anchoring transpeptidase ErfK/SrfK
MQRAVVRLIAAVLFSLAIFSTQGYAAQDPVIASQPPGTIIVKTSQRRLYFVTSEGQAISYSVGVGRANKQWSGTTQIVSMHYRPAWVVPAEVRRDHPKMPEVIPYGSPRNAMGEAAMMLGVKQYAIHGTNNPKSIGGFVSYGCIRMHNKDIVDLFGRVGVGTRVVVTR